MAVQNSLRAAKVKAPDRNRLRIIGGRWRSRTLAFPDVAGVRPTPDRVRETLFNWLQPIIQGACCLDLFSGSGALSFEALSRGACHAVMIENDAVVMHQLRASADTLHASDACVIHGDALEHLTQPRSLRSGPCQTGFDIVFLDPPFRHNLLEACCASLEKRGWLKNDAWIYLEAERQWQPLALPDNWQITHSKSAGEVGYHLAWRRLRDPS